MPSDTAQCGRPIAMILATVLLLGLSAAAPAAAAPADPPARCTTVPAVPADPKAPCPTPPPTCWSPGAAGPTTVPSRAPGGKPATGTPTSKKPASGVTSPCPEVKTPAAHETNWLLIGSITALLLVLLALLAVAVRRSGPGRHSSHAPTAHRDAPAAHRDADPMARRSPAGPARLPGPRPAPRPGNLRPATVGTEFHPQGYVEIDECLYRAVWSEPAETPPGPGEPVDVARPDLHDETHDPHVLLAFPADTRRRDHAR